MNTDFKTGKQESRKNGKFEVSLSVSICVNLWLILIFVCGGCVQTTVVSEPQRSSLNPHGGSVIPSQRGSSLNPHSAPSGVSALKVYVDTMGGLSFNDRLYATPDLAKVLQRQGSPRRIVDLIGREGVTQAQLGIVTTNLSRHGVYNINMIMPRRATATTAE